MSIYSYSSFSLIPSFHFLRNPPVGKGDFLGGDFLPGGWNRDMYLKNRHNTKTQLSLHLTIQSLFLTTIVQKGWLIIYIKKGIFVWGQGTLWRKSRIK